MLPTPSVPFENIFGGSNFDNNYDYDEEYNDESLLIQLSKSKSDLEACEKVVDTILSGSPTHNRESSQYTHTLFQP